jgi:hypothetical protein
VQPGDEATGRGVDVLGDYPENQAQVLLALARLASSAVDARDDWTDYLADPIVAGYVGLTLGGLVLLARSGAPLPLLLLISSVLVFPMFAARHENLPRAGRYLAPLLPLIYTAVAFAGWRLWAHLRQRGPLARSPNAAGIALGLVAAAVLVLYPLLPLSRYYAEREARGETNEPLFRALAEIEGVRRGEEEVVLDIDLIQHRLTGGGTVSRALDFLLTMRYIPHDSEFRMLRRRLERLDGGSVLAVVTDKTYAETAGELVYQPALSPRERNANTLYAVYRLDVSELRRTAPPAVPGS